MIALSRRLPLLAAMALALAAVAAPPPARAGMRAETTRADLAAFYTEIVIAVGAGNPADDEDTPWRRSERSGTIRFSDRDGACRTFFVRQLEPQSLTPYVGRYCAARGQTATIERMRPAEAAGPTGEGRARATNPPPPPPAPTEGAAPDSAPMTSSVAAVKPVIVEIPRSAERRSQNGGQAVVLLSSAPAVAPRNAATCAALVRRFDDATLGEIAVGVERGPSGALTALRPIYWPINDRLARGGGDRCAQRLRVYDYVRSRTIRQKLGLTGSGPYLVVQRADERQAALIDLSRLQTADIDRAVVYFRDGFSQVDAVWDDRQGRRQERENGIRLAFDASFASRLLAALSFVAAPAAQAGCALGDLGDCRR